MHAKHTLKLTSAQYNQIQHGLCTMEARDGYEVEARAAHEIRVGCSFYADGMDIAMHLTAHQWGLIATELAGRASEENIEAAERRICRTLCNRITGITHVIYFDEID